MARERFEEGDYHDVKLKTVNKRQMIDNNMSSTCEVEALMSMIQWKMEVK